MKKAEVITAIMDTYDKNAELRQTIELLRNENEQLRERACLEGVATDQLPSAVGNIDAFMIKIGRKKVYEDCVHQWRNVEASVDEEGVIHCQRFDEWVRNYIGSMPDWISKDQFRQYFIDDLCADYADKKEQAIKAIKEQKSEEGEE